MLTVGSVIYSAKLDRAQLDSAIAQLEKDYKALSFNLKPVVDHKPLTELNRHLDLKQRHFKQLQNQLNTNPITPKVNTKEIDLAAEKIKQLKADSVNISGRINAVVTHKVFVKTDRGETSREKSKEQTTEIVKELRNINRSVKAADPTKLGAILKQNLLTPIASAFTKGAISAFKKSTGLDTRALAARAGKFTGSAAGLGVNLTKDVTSRVTEEFVVSLKSALPPNALDFKTAIANILEKSVDGAYSIEEIFKQGSAAFVEEIGKIQIPIKSASAAFELLAFAAAKTAANLKDNFVPIFAETPIARKVGKQVFGKIGETIKDRKDATDEIRVQKVLEAASLIVDRSRDNPKADSKNLESILKRTRGSIERVAVNTRNTTIEELKLEGVEELALTIGGYAKDKEHQSGILIAAELNRQYDKLGQNKVALGVYNPDTNIKERSAQGILTSLLKPLIRGYSKDAVDIASQALLALMKNENIKIKIIGESGGGNPAQDAVEILNALGFQDRVVGAAFGTPKFTGTRDIPNFQRYVGINRAETLGYESKTLYEPLGGSTHDSPHLNMTGLTGHPIEHYYEHNEFSQFAYGLDLHKVDKFSKENIAEAQRAIQEFIDSANSTADEIIAYFRGLAEQLEKGAFSDLEAESESKKLVQKIKDTDPGSIKLLKEHRSILPDATNLIREAKYTAPDGGMEKLAQYAKQASNLRLQAFLASKKAAGLDKQAFERLVAVYNEIITDLSTNLKLPAEVVKIAEILKLVSTQVQESFDRGDVANVDIIKGQLQEFQTTVGALKGNKDAIALKRQLIEYKKAIVLHKKALARGFEVNFEDILKNTKAYAPILRQGSTLTLDSLRLNQPVPLQLPERPEENFKAEIEPEVLEAGSKRRSSRVSNTQIFKELAIQTEILRAILEAIQSGRGNDGYSGSGGSSRRTPPDDGGDGGILAPINTKSLEERFGEKTPESYGAIAITNSAPLSKGFGAKAAPVIEEARKEIAGALDLADVGVSKINQVTANITVALAPFINEVDKLAKAVNAVEQNVIKNTVGKVPLGEAITYATKEVAKQVAINQAIAATGVVGDVANFAREGLDAPLQHLAGNYIDNLIPNPQIPVPDAGAGWDVVGNIQHELARDVNLVLDQGANAIEGALTGAADQIIDVSTDIAGVEADLAAAKGLSSGALRKAGEAVAPKPQSVEGKGLVNAFDKAFNVIPRYQALAANTNDPEVLGFIEEAATELREAISLNLKLSQSERDLLTNTKIPLQEALKAIDFKQSGSKADTKLREVLLKQAKSVDEAVTSARVSYNLAKIAEPHKATDFVRSGLQVVRSDATSQIAHASSGLESAPQAAADFLASVKSMRQALSTLETYIKKSSEFTKAEKSVLTGKGSVIATTRRQITTGEKAAKSVLAEAKKAGASVSEGIEVGIDSRAKNVIETITTLAQQGTEAAKKVWDIRSPSQVFMQIGKDVLAGLEKGLSAEEAYQIIPENLRRMVRDSEKAIAELPKLAEQAKLEADPERALGGSLYKYVGGYNPYSVEKTNATRIRTPKGAEIPEHELLVDPKVYEEDDLILHHATYAANLLSILQKGLTGLGRSSVEEKIANMRASFGSEGKGVFAILTHKDLPNYKNDRYGDTRLFFDTKAVTPRTTWAPLDSLVDVTPQNEFIRDRFRPLDTHAPSQYFFEMGARSSTGPERFAEAQIHGGVKPSEIIGVDLRKTQTPELPTEVISELASRLINSSLKLILNTKNPGLDFSKFAGGGLNTAIEQQLGSGLLESTLLLKKISDETGASLYSYLPEAKSKKNYRLKNSDKLKEAEESPEGVELGRNLVKDILYNRRDTENLLAKSKGLGFDTIAGIITGLSEESDKLGLKMSDIADVMLDTTKEVLGIHSPSKEFEKIGHFIIEGLKKGLTFNEIHDLIQKEFKGISDRALIETKKARQQKFLGSNDPTKIAQKLQDETFKEHSPAIGEKQFHKGLSFRWSGDDWTTDEGTGIIQLKKDAEIQLRKLKHQQVNVSDEEKQAIKQLIVQKEEAIKNLIETISALQTQHLQKYNRLPQKTTSEAIPKIETQSLFEPAALPQVQASQNIKEINNKAEPPKVETPQALSHIDKLRKDLAEIHAKLTDPNLAVDTREGLKRLREAKTKLLRRFAKAQQPVVEPPKVETPQALSHIDKLRKDLAEIHAKLTDPNLAVDTREGLKRLREAKTKLLRKFVKAQQPVVEPLTIQQPDPLTPQTPLKPENLDIDPQSIDRSSNSFDSTQISPKTVLKNLIKNKLKNIRDNLFPSAIRVEGIGIDSANASEPKEFDTSKLSLLNKIAARSTVKRANITALGGKPLLEQLKVQLQQATVAEGQIEKLSAAIVNKEKRQAKLLEEITKESERRKIGQGKYSDEKFKNLQQLVFTYQNEIDEGSAKLTQSTQIVEESQGLKEFVDRMEEAIAAIEEINSKDILTNDDINRLEQANAALDDLFDRLDENLPDNGITRYLLKLKQLTNNFTNVKQVALGALGAFVLFKGSQLIFEAIGNAIQNFIYQLPQAIRETVTLAAQFESLKIGLSFSGIEDIDGELAKLKARSNEIGANFLVSAQGLRSFSAATVNTSLQAQTPEIFEGLQTGLVSRGANKEQQSNALLAVTQIASKARVSLEEMNQQLSEALPGSLQVAARAMGKSTPEFIKMVENGEVLAEDLLPKLARQFEMESAAGLIQTADSANAAFTRFGNQVEEFQVNFGTALLDPVKAVSAGLTSFLKVFNDNFAAAINIVVALGAAIAVVLVGALWQFIAVTRAGAIAAKLFSTALQLAGVQATGAKGAVLLLGRGLMAIGNAVLPILAVQAAITGLYRIITAGSEDAKEGLKVIEQSAKAIAETIKTEPEQSFRQIGNVKGNGAGEIFNVVGNQGRGDIVGKDIPWWQKIPVIGSTLTLGGRAFENLDIQKDIQRTDEGIKAATKSIEILQSTFGDTKKLAAFKTELGSIRETIDGLKVNRALAAGKGQADRVANINSTIATLQQQERKLIESAFGGDVGNIQAQIEGLEKFRSNLLSRKLSTDPTKYNEQLSGVESLLIKLKTYQEAYNDAIATGSSKYKEMLASIASVNREVANLQAQFESNLRKSSNALKIARTEQLKAATKQIKETGFAAPTNDRIYQRNLLADEVDKRQDLMSGFKVAIAEPVGKLNKITPAAQANLSKIFETQSFSKDLFGGKLSSEAIGQVLQDYEKQTGEPLTPQLEAILQTAQQYLSIRSQINETERQIIDQNLQLAESDAQLQQDRSQFLKDYRSFASDVNEFFIANQRWIQDFDRQLQDLTISLGREARGINESYADLNRSLERQLATAQNELDSVSRKLEAVKLKISLNEGLTPGFDSYAKQIADLFVQAQEEFNSLADDRDNIELSRLDIEQQTLDIARQIRGLQEQQEDFERNRLRQLTDLSRQQADFIRSQSKQWQDILYRYKELEKQAVELGTSMDSVAAQVANQGTSLIAAIADLTNKIAASVGSIPQLTVNPANLTGDRSTEGGGQIVMPASGTFTSPYGMRKHPISGTYKMHHGIDIAAPMGSPINAATEGTVTYSGWMKGYGNVVDIDRGDGYKTRYAHNSENLVKVGDIVKAGQQIAKVGNTGNSTGPHLHFEIIINGKSVDPEKYLGDLNLQQAVKAGTPRKQKIEVQSTPSVTKYQSNKYNLKDWQVEAKTSPNKYFFTPGHPDLKTGTSGLSGQALSIAPSQSVESYMNYEIVRAIERNKSKYNIDVETYLPKPGTSYQAAWAKPVEMERQGYAAVEVHHDAPGGGSGVIPGFGGRGIERTDEKLADAFGATNRNWRDGLGAPKRGITILEVSALTPEIEQIMRNGSDRDRQEYFDTKANKILSALVPNNNAIGGAQPIAAAQQTTNSLLQKLVLAEAGGEGLLGMAGVARSVLNRSALIQSGKVSASTYYAKSGAVDDVINARSPVTGKAQFSPLDNGSINNKWSQAQLNLANEAIRLAQATEEFNNALQSSGLSAQQAKLVLNATGFRNRKNAPDDPSQNYNLVKLGQHTFNADKFSAGLANVSIPSVSPTSPSFTYSPSNIKAPEVIPIRTETGDIKPFNSAVPTLSPIDLSVPATTASNLTDTQTIKTQKQQELNIGQLKSSYQKYANDFASKSIQIKEDTLSITRNIRSQVEATQSLIAKGKGYLTLEEEISQARREANAEIRSQIESYQDQEKAILKNIDGTESLISNAKNAKLPEPPDLSDTGAVAKYDEMIAQQQALIKTYQDSVKAQKQQLYIIRENLLVLTLEKQAILDKAAATKELEQVQARLAIATKITTDYYDALAENSLNPYDKAAYRRESAILQQKNAFTAQMKEFKDSVKPGAIDKKTIDSLYSKGLLSKTEMELITEQGYLSVKQFEKLKKILEDTSNIKLDNIGRDFSDSIKEANTSALEYMGRTRIEGYNALADREADPFKKAEYTQQSALIEQELSYNAQLAELERQAQILPQVRDRYWELKEAIDVVNQTKLDSIAEQTNVFADIANSSFNGLFTGLLESSRNGFKDIGDVFVNFIKSISDQLNQLVANYLTRLIITSIFKGALGGAGGGFIGDALGGGAIALAKDGLHVGNFNDGGETTPKLKIQNFANGGSILALGMAVKAAMKREGAGAVPIVAHRNEQVLTDRNGDAQFWRYLKKKGDWDYLKQNRPEKTVDNFADGGTVGSNVQAAMGNQGRSGKGGNKQQPNVVNINSTVNVSTPDANSFRRSAAQIAAEQRLKTERASRNL